MNKSSARRLKIINSKVPRIAYVYPRKVEL